MSVAHRTYARALFQAAKERGELGEVREELTSFAGSAADIPELRNLLRNPQVDPREKRRMLSAILGGGNELVQNFLLVLAEKNRADQVAEIHREFERLAAADEGRLEVELTTAMELSDEEFGRIVGRIEQASGRRVDATRKVDSDLIGGLVLQAGSLRLDASVRGRLNGLRQQLATR